jgi:hypothetical protein
MEIPSGGTQWFINDISWTTRTTFSGLTGRPALQSSDNLRDVIELLVKIFTVDVLII